MNNIVVESIYKDYDLIYKRAKLCGQKVFGYEVRVRIDINNVLEFYLRQKEFPNEEQIIEEVKKILKEE